MSLANRRDPLLGKDPFEIEHTLSARKAAGEEVFDWAQVTYEDLCRLYLDYRLIPAMIADLYGVTKEQVNLLRQKWKIRESDRSPDPETVRDVRLLLEQHEAAVLQRVVDSAAPYESRFSGANGAHWRLTLNNNQLRITRAVDGSPESTWSAANRRDAELLLAAVRKGPESDVASWVEMFDAFEEIAAAYEEFEDGMPSFLSRAGLDEHEQAWLTGSLRTALALWR